MYPSWGNTACVIKFANTHAKLKNLARKLMRQRYLQCKGAECQGDEKGSVEVSRYSERRSRSCPFWTMFTSPMGLWDTLRQ